MALSQLCSLPQVATPRMGGLRRAALISALAGAVGCAMGGKRAPGGGRALGPRLHTPQPLAVGALIALPDAQRHYLLSVMRLKPGHPCRLFNAVDGEFEASVGVLDKRSAEIGCISQIRPPPPVSAGSTLLFGVLKGPRLPMLIEKATELGVGTLQPVVSEYCATRDLNIDRLAAIAIEAAEQSGRLSVPEVLPAAPLLQLLSTWGGSPLFACDERGGDVPLARAARDSAAAGRALAVLVGPEGGLSPAEFEALARMDCVTFVSLGPNILRAETAAMAALALLGSVEA